MIQLTQFRLKDQNVFVDPSIPKKLWWNLEGGVMYHVNHEA